MSLNTEKLKSNIKNSNLLMSKIVLLFWGTYLTELKQYYINFFTAYTNSVVLNCNIHLCFGIFIWVS